MSENEIYHVVMGYEYSEMFQAYKQCLKEEQETYPEIHYYESFKSVSMPTVPINGIDKSMNKIDAYTYAQQDADNLQDYEGKGIFIHDATGHVTEFDTICTVDVEIPVREIVDKYGFNYDTEFRITEAIKRASDEQINKEISKKKNKHGIPYDKNAVYSFDRSKSFDMTTTCLDDDAIQLSTVTTPGELVTKYFIIDSDNGILPRWDDGFVSQEEAVKNLSKNPLIGSRQEIIAMTRRGNGDPLVTHEKAGYTQDTMRYRVAGPVTQIIITEDKDKTGFLFYGKVDLS